MEREKWEKKEKCNYHKINGRGTNSFSIEEKEGNTVKRNKGESEEKKN